MIKKVPLVLLAFVVSIVSAFAQNEDTLKVTSKAFGGEQQVVNELSKNGKIYIVIIVLSIILTGLFIYLYKLDNKLTRIEQQQKD